MKSWKIISLFIGFTLLIISLIWLRVSQQHQADQQAAIAAAIQRNSNLVVALEQYTIRTIRNVDVVLQIIKREYEKEGPSIDILKKQAEYSLDSDFTNNVVIINEEGKLVASSYAIQNYQALHFSNRPPFQYHSQMPAGGLHISQPLISLTNKKAMIILSRRLTRPDGRFGGIVSIQIEPATFTRFYADAQLRQHDIISLIAPNGITYARRTGAVESHSEDIHNSPLFSYVKQRGVGDYFANDAIRGIPTYFSYRKLKEYPIIATVGTSKEDALASYVEGARKDSIFTTLICLLILLFGAFSYFALQHRKRIIKKVRESEIKYRSIVNNSHDVILLVHPDGGIRACNPAANKAFLMEEASLLQKQFKDLLGASTTDSNAVVNQALTTPAFESELLFVRSDGSLFIGEMVSSLHTDAAGKESVTVIIRDVTERRRIAAILKKKQKQFQQKLTRQVIVAQEREREEIGRELHDNVNQVLTSAKLYLEMANSNTEMSKTLLPKSIDLLVSSINEIRFLSHNLSAPTLGTSSLIDSITALIDTVKTPALFNIYFSHETFRHDIAKEQKLALYRIVQEQLNNISKHAKAATIHLALAQTDNNTVLTIKDDGIGFDTKALRTGIGLNNIISRAKAFEGNVQIQSQPGAGCTLIVSLPTMEVASSLASSSL